VSTPPPDEAAARELVVLGTSSQVPTRYRNHNGYLLRLGAEGLLFDPGEGTQRQMVRAGVGAVDVTRALVTHFHGDHCLGLAGLSQLAGRDGGAPIPVHFPRSGRSFFGRLKDAAILDAPSRLQPEPIAEPGRILDTERLTIDAVRLDHGVETFGYRVWCAAEGEAPAVTVAFVMDTRVCAGAYALAHDVDLLIIESTYLSSEAREAKDHGHLTARQAALIGRDAGARRIVLTHFSQRYPSAKPFVAEAREVHGDVVAARDGRRLRL
jgi:ribonuclease Z